MSLIKKSEGKNHLPARHPKEVHLDEPASQPAATGFSKAEPGARKANSSDFAEGFQPDDSFPGTAIAPRDPLPNFIGPGESAASKSAQAMKLHSVFLRKGCILPDGLNWLREPIGKDWTLVEEPSAPAFDRIIRQAGWHFMWMCGSCSRRGFGLTRNDAADRALARALRGIARRFNAAELDSVLDTKFPGFHVANVALQPRQIQQHTTLVKLDETHLQAGGS